MAHTNKVHCRVQGEATANSGIHSRIKQHDLGLGAEVVCYFLTASHGIAGASSNSNERGSWPPVVDGSAAASWAGLTPTSYNRW